MLAYKEQPWERSCFAPLLLGLVFFGQYPRARSRLLKTLLKPACSLAVSRFVDGRYRRWRFHDFSGLQGAARTRVRVPDHHRYSGLGLEFDYFNRIPQLCVTVRTPRGVCST